MKWQIIFAGLRARPVRTGVTILAVALQVSLILVMVGLTTGTAAEIGRRVSGVGADIVFQPPDADVLLAASGASLDPAMGEKIASVEGVKSVTPVLVRTNLKKFTMFFGIDPKTFDEVSGGLVYIKGRVFSGPDEVVIDDIFAKDKNLDVGSDLELQNHHFKVSGIVENGKGVRIFMALAKAQELNSTPNAVSIFFVKLKDSSDINGAIQKMKMEIPGYEIRNGPEYAALMTGANIPAIDAVNEVIVFVALCIGVLVIFLSMYTTIMERTREIGILRSLGASKAFIVTLIMNEAILICLIGVVLGTLGSFAIVRVAREFSPTLAFLISYPWMINAALSALASGVVGSLHPSLKAASQDPVEAFAYE
jgi:putative ABC transport system permease protein